MTLRNILVAILAIALLVGLAFPTSCKKKETNSLPVLEKIEKNSPKKAEKNPEEKKNEGFDVKGNIKVEIEE